MTSVSAMDITVVATEVIDSSVARLRGPFSSQEQDKIVIVQYHQGLSFVVGKSPKHSLLLSSVETSQNAFFHAACVYLPDHDLLYTTSRPLQTTSLNNLPVILISHVKLRHSGDGRISSAEWKKLRPPSGLAMPAGAIRCQDGVLYCSQGNMEPGSGGLYLMPHGQPPQQMIGDYHGRQFNSPYGVAMSADGCVWFTDPAMGFEQEFRPPPQLPCHVYRYDTKTNEVRAMADGLGRPTGLAFGPDGKTMYVSDSSATKPGEKGDLLQPATIYAFDIVDRSDSVFLANRRLFAFALRGNPLHLGCDRNGNVYAACSDGVEVWNPGGSLLGVIRVPGGVTSFCFTGEDDMFLCAGQRLWRVEFDRKASPEAGRGIDNI